MTRQTATQSQQQTSITSQKGGILQRKCESCGQHTIAGRECKGCQQNKLTLQRHSDSQNHQSEVPPIVDEVLRSPSQPLDSDTRTFMESRFGHDFSQVRVHSDAKAAESAQVVNALAYTVGRDMVFAADRYRPKMDGGRKLIAHELTHVVQQNRQASQFQPRLEIGKTNDATELQAETVAQRVTTAAPLASIDAISTPVLQRQEFQPWPGAIGTDVPGTHQEIGNVISERVQRTGSPNYTQPQPILLEFDRSTCTLTSTMEINFVHPANQKDRLSDGRFTRLKTRILDVARDKLNGWMTIQVGDAQACTTCRGRSISVNVVAREGNSADASTVELRRGTGRASSGQIFEGGDNWFTALLGGVSNGTLWHEAGHIVLGTDDEYPPEPGDPSRPATSVNESDWSVMASHDAFGRRAVMHPRHFSFMSAWLRRRFSNCTFNLVAQPRPIVIDVVAGLSVSAASLGGGWGLGESLDLLVGIPLERQRRLRLLVGGYGSLMGTLSRPNRNAFLVGALVGLDYSTNRSAGGFGLRADFQVGGANLDTSGTDPERNRWVPTIGGGLGIGYLGPKGEIGATGSVGTALSGSFKGDPYFLLGLRAGINF
jgi:hypothetical protein